MASVVAQLVPMILGAMLAPIWLIIVLLLLASPKGLGKAVGFLLGITLVRLLQGALFGLVFGASPDAAGESDGSSPVVSTLLLVVGILMLVTSYRKWRKEDDPDDPPPKWMQSIDRTTPLRAIGLGAALTGIAVKLWVFTLSAIGVIRAAGLEFGQSVGAYLIYVLLAQLLLIAPIALSAVAPQAAGSTLRRASDWLARYNRPITIVVTLIFGTYFTWSAIAGLLA